jgi:hypothetical protein
MMNAQKLYMIRLENGNSVITQAANEPEALELIGFNADPTTLAAEMNEADVPSVHWALVQSGVGPQKVTIRELHDFACDVVLKDDGSFHVTLGNYEMAEEEFLDDYPDVRVALHAIDEQDDPRLTTDFAREVLSEAVEKERTRLMPR